MELHLDCHHVASDIFYSNGLPYQNYLLPKTFPPYVGKNATPLSTPYKFTSPGSVYIVIQSSGTIQEKVVWDIIWSRKFIKC
jgi:hypothetical protein